MKKTLNRPYSVTIGIPAFNEAKNILQLLEAIMRQKSRIYKIKKIVVACDGSTDNTPELVAAYAKKNTLVKMIYGKKRKGKTQRLNELFARHQGDVFISIDADVLPADKTVFEKVIRSFSDPEVYLVAANSRPMKGRTLAEKIASTNSNLWYEAVKDINNGDTIFNISGQMFAVRGSFVKKIKYPKDVFADEKYLYLLVKEAKKKFVFAKQAIITFRSPATLKDYFYQSSRFLLEHDQVEKYFSPELVQTDDMPVMRKVIASAKMLFRSPVYTSFVFVCLLVFRFFPHHQEKIASHSVWTNIASTKELIADLTIFL